jgi:glycosyltransferase 2 family protein
LKKKIVAALKYILFLSVGLTLLWLALRGLDLSKIGLEFRQAKYFWIILSLIPALIAHISRAARWNIMINAMGYKTTLGSTFHATIMGYFANTIFPRLGEVTRCTVLSRKQNIPLNGLFGTVISERIFDVICIAIIGFFVIIAQFSFLRGFLEKMIWSNLSEKMPSGLRLITLLGISVLLAAVLFYFLLKFSMPIIRKLSFYKKLKDLILGFLAGIKTIGTLKRKKEFIAHTILIWFMYFLMSYLPFRAIQATEHLSLVDGTTLLMMGSFAMVIPVPAGIGAYHWIVTRTLTDLYGIVSESAASYAVLAHASQLIFVVLLGGISMLVVMVHKTQPLNVKIRSHTE